MKAKTFIALLMTTLLVLGCQSKAEKEFQALTERIEAVTDTTTMSDYQQLQSDIHDYKMQYPGDERLTKLKEKEFVLQSLWTNIQYNDLLRRSDRTDLNTPFVAVDSLMADIKGFINNYNHPSYASLDDHLVRLIKLRESMLMRQLIDNTARTIDKPYTSYLDRIDTLKTLADLYVQYDAFKIKDVSLKSDFNQSWDRCLRAKQAIESERDRYEVVKESSDLLLISDFLVDYPESIMRDEIRTLHDNLLFADLTSQVDTELSSISELNNVIAAFEERAEQLYTAEYKDKVASFIERANLRRSAILKLEVRSRYAELLVAMESAARDEALSRTTNYKVDELIVQEPNPRIAGVNFTVSQLYQVNMVGSFLGFDRRTLMIRVYGKVEGDLDQGVTLSVVRCELLSNNKK